MAIPAVIFQYVYPDADVQNQYIPYLDVYDAVTDLEDYLRKNGVPGNINIYVDPAHGEEFAEILQKVCKDISGEIVGIYGITPGVLRLAL